MAKTKIKGSWSDRLIGWLLVAVFLVGLAIAVGCIMSFLGFSFLGIVEISRWVAAIIWVVCGLISLAWGFNDPNTYQTERTEGSFLLGVAWIVLWPLVWLLQGGEVLL